MRLVQQVLALYPIPFLLVTLVVLLQRPDDPHAWLLALMLGGFIAGAGITEFEYRVPSWMRGSLVAVSTAAGCAAGRPDLRLLRRLPRALATRPPRCRGSRRSAWYWATRSPRCWPSARWWGRAATSGSGSTSGSRRWMAPVGILILIYSAGFFLLAVVSLVQNAFGPVDVRRKTRVILFGLVVGARPSSCCSRWSGATGTRPYELPPWFWVSSILLLFAIPLSLGYAVVKHRAMEIPVLLRRSARYLLVRRGLVTVAVLAGIAVTLGFARLFDSVPFLGSMDRTRGGLMVGSLFGGMMVLVGRRVWQPAMERLDRAFFRGSYDARHLLIDAGGADAHGQRSHHACRDDRPRGAPSAASEDAARVSARRRRLDISGSGARGVVGRRGAPAHCACPAGGSRAARTAAVAGSRANSNPERRGPPWPPCRQRRWCR